MAEEIDDTEFFQQDFTTASEWEIFNARLDEIFLDWKLPYKSIGKPLKKNEIFLSNWEANRESIFFANVEMTVSHYRIKEPEESTNADQVNSESLTPTKSTKDNSLKICQSQLDLMSFENNFYIYDETSNLVHPLAAWYGLREFVVIESATGSLINETQFKILLSSACISVTESNTEIPVFVRVMEKNINVFLGVCESPSMRINFDIVALEMIPPTCRYLSGLLCMFKGKIKTTYSKPVTVSVQLTYSLKDFGNYEFYLKSKIQFSTEIEDDSDDASNYVAEGSKFCVLPYGVSIDPITELILHCTWPEIAENVIVDSSTYSDLDPMLAPFWSILVNCKSKKNPPIYYLTDTLEEFLKLTEINRSLGSILGSSYELGSSQNLEGENPLDLLTQSKIPSLKSVIPNIRELENRVKGKEKKKLEGPINEVELMQMLYYLFPDAQPEPLFPYDEIEEKEVFDPMRIKSAAPDTLVFRLSSLLATCNMYFSGLSAVAQLWAEFTQEMRYRVERCIQIPGVGPGFPDSRTCLLHQKLQMLNVCVERRRLREGNLPFSMMESKGIRKIQKHEDSDEEFYDCDDDEDEDNNRHSEWNKPAGRLEKLENLTLIDSDESLYIPVTQDPVPKTEDQLEDDAEVMLKLGPGSELCAQMMSASLLSDMESFKAANPSGKLEDFIRWYSPRDWIVETNEIGESVGTLSQRMQLPGNTWQVVWSQAKPVPARRQRRLFDDTKEAEKVLHFFETRTIGQICELVIAPLFHSAILKLKDELSNSKFSDFFQENLEKLSSNLCKLSRDSWNLTIDPPTRTINSPRKWEILLNEIINLEHLILQSRSIIRKLFHDTKILSDRQKIVIQSILKGLDAELFGGAKNPISVDILNLFSDARHLTNEFNMDKDTPSQLYLPEPIRKEYILRVDGKTSSKENAGPQFLRAILDKHMRLCGAFSENTTFV